MIKWYIDAENKNAFSARCMPTISDFGLIGILYVNVDYDKLFAPFEQTIRPNYGIFITDENENVIFSTTQFENDYKEYEVDYDKFLYEKNYLNQKSQYAIVESISKRTGWKIGL